MSIWERLIGKKSLDQEAETNSKVSAQTTYNPENFAVVDCEISVKDHVIRDIGAWRYDNAFFHKTSKSDLQDFIKDVDFLCGHNIINHDAKFLFENIDNQDFMIVDTLYVSPLLFPERPYHRLLKDDKLVSDQINNPVNDCLKARDLLYDELSAWKSLPEEKRNIYATLLSNVKEFEGFMVMAGAFDNSIDVISTIKHYFAGKICSNADIERLVKNNPCELAFSLALIDTSDYRSITPGWIIANFPQVEYVVKSLRHNRCKQGCDYCNSKLDVTNNLKTIFGYDQFRTYNGEPLQQLAAQAAVDNKSLLAIFPTGGGKSITFQLPALMAGESLHGLTVVISPLQSLMKDQVDNLIEKGITGAVTINGLLDPISRSVSIQRVIDGDATLLYISPEMLRSMTIERVLLARNVVRFVVDEAHCFSAWGQDFRVDYLYIGDFIKKYQEKKVLRLRCRCLVLQQLQNKKLYKTYVTISHVN